MSLTPVFPEHEIDDRYRRARALMAQENLDALMATDITNYVYFGGHKIMKIMAGSRPQLIILPREGRPVLIAQSLFEQLIRKTSWIDDVKLWREFPFTIRPVIEAFEQLELTKARIGVDLGGEYRLGMSYSDFAELKRKMPEADFIDASGIFLKLRLIKSDTELERMRKACDITSKAYEKLFGTVRIGMTEMEIGVMMSDFIAAEGGNVGFVSVYIWPGATLTNSPTDRSLKKGDTLFLDSGASVDGYTCDFSRLGSAGEPSAYLEDMYKLCRDITMKEVNAVKPGVKVSEVARVGCRELERAGMKEKSAGRDGHGLGLGGLELPSISLNDNTTLEPGMIITIEPEVSTVTLGGKKARGFPEFRFVEEENMLVTESGYEILSCASRGLHVI